MWFCTYHWFFISNSHLILTTKQNLFLEEHNWIIGSLFLFGYCIWQSAGIFYKLGGQAQSRCLTLAGKIWNSLNSSPTYVVAQWMCTSFFHQKDKTSQYSFTALCANLVYCHLGLGMLVAKGMIWWWSVPTDRWTQRKKGKATSSPSSILGKHNKHSTHVELAFRLIFFVSFWKTFWEREGRRGRGIDRQMDIENTLVFVPKCLWWLELGQGQNQKPKTYSTPPMWMAGTQLNHHHRLLGCVSVGS